MLRNEEVTGASVDVRAGCELIRAQGAASDLHSASSLLSPHQLSEVAVTTSGAAADRLDRRRRRPSRNIPGDSPKDHKV